MRLIIAVGLACCTSFVFAATPPKAPSLSKVCPFDEGSSYVLQVKKVPDLDQACYEVIHENQKGYVCVWAEGTPEKPYGFTRNLKPELVTDRGYIGGGNYGYDADESFFALCSWLVRDQIAEEAKKKFDPNTASDGLDEFFSQE